MKIYTGTGDSGKTSLFSGERISKSDARIEAYGAVDELNAIIGAMITTLPECAEKPDLKSQLIQIQSDLFHVGAWMATTPDSPSTAHLTPLTASHNQRLESQIDAMEEKLEKLHAFILPGGHVAATWAHLARTVCRRAERRAVTLAATETKPSENTDNLLIYLNRLSDYLFVAARFCNRLAGVEDQVWKD